MAIQRSSGILLLCLLSAGCGAKTGGKNGDDLPPIMVSISISPETVHLVQGNSAALTATARMDDGQEFAVAAGWSAGTPGIVSFSLTSSASVTIGGIGLGSTSVAATYHGFQATAQVDVVDWTAPSLTGQVFGLKRNGDLLRYSPDGTPAPSYDGLGAAFGFAVNRDATSLFATGTLKGSSSRVIVKLGPDAMPGDPGHVVPLPADASGFGLDVGADGRVLMQAFSSGLVTWYNPANDLFEPGGTLEISQQISLALTPAGEILTTPMLTGPGGVWVRRQDPVAATQEIWATVSFEVTTNNGFVTASGIAVDDGGEVFLVNYEGSDVFRAVDTDGDGFALSDGEVTRFATIPAGIAAGKGGICGLCNAGGRRGLLVNAMVVVGDGTGSSGLGIYFVADLNANGNADDPGEVTLFSATALPNDADTGCVGAAR